jgi:hypothetical protein
MFAPSVQETVSGTAAEVSRRLLPELAELRRIIGDQGDAADEVAEALGRTLTRLSAEVTDLAAEVVRLRERLDRSDSVP